MPSAVVINARSKATGVQAERMWINEHYPGARLKSQSLLNRHGRVYDAIEVAKGDGKVLTLYFDISSYFGKFQGKT